MKTKAYLIISAVIGSLLSATCMAHEPKQIRLEIHNNTEQAVGFFANISCPSGTYHIGYNADMNKTTDAAILPGTVPSEEECTITYSIGSNYKRLFDQRNVDLGISQEVIGGYNTFSSIDTTGSPSSLSTPVGTVNASYAHTINTLHVTIDDPDN